MRVVQLTEAEASNAAVMTNVAKYLLSGGDFAVAHVDDVFALRQGTDRRAPGLTDMALQQAGASEPGVLSDLSRQLVENTPDGYIEGFGIPMATATEPMVVNVHTQKAQPAIDPADIPSAGFPPDAPAAAPAGPAISPHVFTDPAKIGFGSQLPPEPMNLPAVPASPVGGIPLPPPASAISTAAGVPAAPALPPVAPGAAHGVPVPQASPVLGEVDKEGLIWDERIHSSSKEKNADGRWRARRFKTPMYPAEHARIVAEIRAVMAIPAPATVAQAPAVPSAPTIPQTPTLADFGAVPPAPPLAPAMTFDEWLKEMTPKLVDGSITPALIGKLVHALGYDAAGGLNTFVMRPELIPAARTKLNEWLADPAQVPQ